MAKLPKNGYAQVELNQVAFARDGRIEAQLPFIGTVGDTCENGMIVGVDKAGGSLGYAAATANKLYGLVYTSEELYDVRKGGLKDFGFKCEGTSGTTVAVGPDGYHVLPRVGFLSAGDRFTTNAVDTNSIDFEGTQSGATIYGEAGASGDIVLSLTAPTDGPILQLAKVTTLPDGQKAIKFVVLDA